MTEQTTAIVAKSSPIEEREVAYTPFGSADKIQLTVGMVTKFLCRPTKQGFICSPEQAVRFMMLCKARGLNPWEGDAFLVGYDTKDGPEFNLITAHQSFLKRAEAHPMFDGMESGVIVADDNDVLSEVPGDFLEKGLKLAGGWAKVHRKDRKFPVYRRLNLSAFEKTFGVWVNNPQGMIVKTAEADAMRSAFPNSLAGMLIEGEAVTEPSGKTGRQMTVTQPANPAAALANIIDAAETKQLGSTTPVKAPEQETAATVPATATETASAATAKRSRKPASETVNKAPDAAPPVNPAASSGIAAGSGTSKPADAPAAKQTATEKPTGMFDDDVDDLETLSEEEKLQVEGWQERGKEKAEMGVDGIDYIVSAINDKKTSARRKERLFVKTMIAVLASEGFNANGTPIKVKVPDSPTSPVDKVPSPAPINQVEQAINPPPAEPPPATPTARPATVFDIDTPIGWEDFLAQCLDAAQLDLSKTITDPEKLSKAVSDAEKSTRSKFGLRHGWVGKPEEKAKTEAGQGHMTKAMDLMLEGKWNWTLAKPL